MPKGAVQDSRTATKAVKLRDMIRELEIDAANLEGSSPQRTLALLRLRDDVEDEIQRLEDEGLDLRPERTRIKTVDNIVLRKASRIQRGLRPVGGMEKVREQENPPEERWWWYLDLYLAEQGRKQAIKWISIVVGVLLLLVGGNYVMNRFFGMDPVEKEARSYTSLGEQKMIRGEYEAAIVEYEKAVETLPTLGDAYVALGVLYEVQGRQQDAEEALAQARANIDDETRYLLLLAQDYQSVGEDDAALEAVQQAIEREPDSAQAHLIRGGIYEAMDEQRQALADYERAAELAQEAGEDPLYVLARMRMGMLLQRGSGGGVPGGAPGVGF